MTKETVSWSASPSRSDGIRSDLNLSFGLNDDEMLAALDQIFPDEYLPAAPSHTVGQRSIGVDTIDLPPCCRLATSSHSPVPKAVDVSSVAVDTIDLSNSADPGSSEVSTTGNFNKSVLPVSQNPPSQIFPSPPITPVDTDGGKEKLVGSHEKQPLPSAVSLPFPDLGPDVMGCSPARDGGNFDSDEGEGNLTAHLSTPPRRVAFSLDTTSPQRPVRLFGAPERGFSTPQPAKSRSRLSRLLENSASKTPNSITTRRSYLRRANGADAGEEGQASPGEGRQLRPRPTPPTRYFGEPFRCPKGEEEAKNSKSKLAMITEGQGKRGEESEKTAKKRKGGSGASAKSKKEPSAKKKKNEGEAQKTLDKGGERNHICEVCDKAYLKVVGLRTHNEVCHLGVRYRCKICGMISTMVPSVAKHVHKTHLGEDAKKAVERFVE